MNKIEIYVSDPYPCWARIRVNGNEVASLHHSELIHLLHATETAIQEAVSKLMSIRMTVEEAKVEVRLP